MLLDVIVFNGSITLFTNLTDNKYYNQILYVIFNLSFNLLIKSEIRENLIHWEY